MQFKTIILTLAALATTAQAAPIISDSESSSPNPTSANAIGLIIKRQNLCGTSSFANHTSGGSPTVANCQSIVSNISGGGSWSCATGSGTKILSYGTCAFWCTKTGGSGTASVGANDVTDLITDSIKKFASGGKIGAQGSMPCGATTVQWGIYHN